jgi:acetylornithine deacetylase
MQSFGLPSADMLARLVAFDSVSSNSNLPLITWVADYLDGLGVPCHLTYNEDRTKANLFATIGPGDEGGVCLHGHTDVVPVAGQPWSSDPFTLTRKEGRLYGRGTCDMKAWLACALAAAPDLARRRLRTPIHLALSYDEETGCLGAPGMIASFGRDVPKPLAAIVGEPSVMAPIVAHKGMIAMDTTFTGRDAHSSLLHLGVSAVSAAAEMAVELHRLAREWRGLPGPAGMEPSGPTVSVGMLQGGVARNVIPRHASLLWELRFRAGDNPSQLLEDAMARIALRLRRSFGSDYEVLRMETRQLAEIPAFQSDPEGLAVLLARRLGATGQPRAVPYSAEAGQYAAAGISTVICGPGSIDQAHQPDEFIAWSELEACDRFIAQLGDWACEVALDPKGAPLEAQAV